MPIYLAVSEHVSIPINVEALAERAVWDAKRAIGDLTRLANDAQTVDQALRYYRLAHEVEEAAHGCVGVALTRTDAISEQQGE